MENKLQIFNYQNNNVRTVIKDGEVWFVAKDLAEILGYESPDKMYKHVDSEDRQIQIESPERQNGGSYKPPKKYVIINESGVYSAIFGSILPEAKQFKRWVTHEVLPSIRKSGQYIANQLDATPIITLTKTIAILQDIIEEQKKELTQLKTYLPITKENNIENKTDLTQLANILKVGRTTFFRKLRELNILEKKGIQHVPLQQYIDNGYFTIETTFFIKGGNKYPIVKTFVTQEGILFIRDIINV